MKRTSLSVIASSLGILAAAAVVVVGEGLLQAQKSTPADVAAAFTGTWTLNRALSPALAPAPNRGGGGGSAPRGGGMIAGPDFALAVAPAQGRGGGGGGGSNSGGAASMSSGDQATQTVIRSFQLVPETVTIKAAADSVVFTDPRGERTFPVTGKDAKTEISGVELTTNSKWDKNTLKQKVLSGESSLTLTWELASSNDRMNFKVTSLNLADPTRISEIKAVYDKQK
jgi:hypothetical protein